MSTDGFSLSIHGATLDEFLERFQAVAQRLGFIVKGELYPQAGAEAPPTEETADYFPPSDAVGAKTALAAVNGPVRRRPGRPLGSRSASASERERPLGARSTRAVVKPVVAAVAAARDIQEEVSDVCQHSQPEQESPPVTLEDAKLAGREVIHTGGVDALRGLLTEFSIGRIGELKKEAWSQFIVRCHEVAQGAEPHA